MYIFFFSLIYSYFYYPLNCTCAYFFFFQSVFHGLIIFYSFLFLCLFRYFYWLLHCTFGCFYCIKHVSNPSIKFLISNIVIFSFIMIILPFLCIRIFDYILIFIYFVYSSLHYLKHINHSYLKVFSWIIPRAFQHLLLWLDFILNIILNIGHILLALNMSKIFIIIFWTFYIS